MFGFWPPTKTLSIEAISYFWGDLSFKLFRWFHLNNCSRPKDVKYFTKRQKSKRKHTIFAGKLCFFATSLIIAQCVDYYPLGDYDDDNIFIIPLYLILGTFVHSVQIYYFIIRLLFVTYVSCFLYLPVFVTLFIIMFIVSHNQTIANLRGNNPAFYFWDFHYILLTVLLYFYLSMNLNEGL